MVDDVRTCLYVAGTTQGLTTGNDIVLLKVGDGLFGYLPGEVVWAKTASATVGRDDEAEAVAMDKAGNVYVTGGAESADGTMDVITVKFLPDGTVAWKKRHNNATTRFDRGLAIAVYGSSVYVAGLSNRSGHGDDLVLLKYTTGGERKWVRYFDDPLNRHESVTGIAVAGTAVYVCGSGKATATKPGDALLVKFRTDGTVRLGPLVGRQRRRGRRLVRRGDRRQGTGARDRLSQAGGDRHRHRHGDVLDCRRDDVGTRLLGGGQAA